jgi:methionine-rich copper-binding protein CopC
MPSRVFGKRTVRGRVVRLLTAALVLWSGALLAPASALAHAELIEVSPADGSRVEAPPATFSITFNEQVGLESDAVRIVDATGRQVDLAPEVVTGSVVTQALPPLAAGWYLATWTVTSTDGHILNQASTFGVGAASEASRTAALALRSSTEPASWLMRFTADLTLLVAVGAAAAWAFMSARSQRVQQLRRGSLAVAAIATLAWWIIEAVIGGGAAGVELAFAVRFIWPFVLSLFLTSLFFQDFLFLQCFLLISNSLSKIYLFLFLFQQFQNLNFYFVAKPPSFLTFWLFPFLSKSSYR